MNKCFIGLRLFSLILFLGAAKSADAEGVFKLADFGGVADGITMNTEPFAKAIGACSAASGGRVVVGAGIYLTGPIHLATDVELHLDRGATVLFSRHFEDYPLIVTNFEGKQTVRCTSPISGDDLQNVSITGDGTFDGQGDFWRPAKKTKYNEAGWSLLLASGGVIDPKSQVWYPSEAARNGSKELNRLRESGAESAKPENYVKFRELLRPVMVSLSRCRNLVLNGPTFRNSPEWNLHLFLCDGVTIRNVNLYNPIYAQNGDGIDIDSCRNLTMTDSTVNAGDDAICLKSGRDEEGRKLGKPTENITISNCTIGTGHGGIVVGSEMSGGVRNVSVSNCIMEGTDAGLRFKTTRGRGGIVENIQINNIEMKNIRGPAIVFTMYYMVKRPTTKPAESSPVAPAEPAPDTTADVAEPDAMAINEGTPQFRQIHISNVHCESSKQGLVMRGLPEMPVQQITIENTRIATTQPGSIIDCKDIILRDVQINAPKNVTIKSSVNIVQERVTGVDSKEATQAR